MKPAPNAEEIIFSREFIEWLANGERGASSETIAEAITGIKCGSDIHVPYDYSDFCRCMNLLEKVPKMRKYFSWMSRVSTTWENLVYYWGQLEQWAEEVRAGKRSKWNVDDCLEKIRYGKMIWRTPQIVVYDHETSLEWLTGPDENTSFADAEKWIESLGDGWAMPTLAQLRTLYQEGVGDRNMPTDFATTGWCVWASDPHEDSSNAFGFGFDFGGEGWRFRDFSHCGRVFAVRPGRLVDNLTT